MRLTNKSHKSHLLDFLYILSERLRTVSLEDFLPSATRVPPSLLPLQEAAGWTDEASMKVIRAVAPSGGPGGVTSKACQLLILLNAVTANVRLTNKSHKSHLPDFLYILSGRLRTVSLEDFLPNATILLLFL